MPLTDAVLRELLLYFVPMALTPLVSGGLAWYAWRRRDVPGAAVFTLFMLAVAGWSLATVGLELSPTPEAALFWYKLRYLGIASVPTLWLIFGIQYTGYGHILTPGRISLLLAIPLITQVMVWAVPAAFVPHVDFAHSGAIMMIVDDLAGPWFIVHFVYAFGSVLAGIALIVLGLQSAHLYRGQAVALVLGGLPPFIFSAVLATFVDKSVALLTPLGFLLMGGIYTWALFRFRLLDLSSISRTVLVERMEEGVLVLDAAGRVVDINPAGSRIFGQPAPQLIGVPVRQLLPLPVVPPGVDLLADTQIVEVPLPQNGRERWFSVKINPLHAERQKGGCLLLVEDITERKASQQALRQLNEALESKVAQRTYVLEQRARQLELISQIASALRQAVTKAEMLEILVREVAGALNADSGLVWLARAGEFPAEAGVPDWLENSLNDDQPRVFEAPQLTPGQLPPRYAELVGRAARLVAAPLQSTQGRLGVLLLAFAQPVQLSGAELQMIRAVAEMAGNALHRINLHDVLEHMAQDRTRRLAILYEITAIANEYQQLDQILSLILELTLSVADSPAGFVHLLDEAEQQLQLAACQGLPPARLTSLPGPHGPAPVWEQVFEAEQICFTPEIDGGEMGLSDRLRFAGLPISKKGRKLGTLCLVVKAYPALADEDTALLTAIADQAGIAVESARLRGQAEQAAVMVERQRLARELHDSVTQALYGSVLLGKAGLASFARGGLEDAQHSLARVVENSQQALTEMRLLIYELRPVDLAELGLQEALRQRLAAVESRVEIRASLKYEAAVEITGATALGLYRIVQEALNNVLKHARASRVEVDLLATSELIRLVVADDGMAFDVRAAPKTGGMGLASIRERAEELNGQLVIQSSRGTGTRLMVECPTPEDAVRMTEPSALG